MRWLLIIRPAIYFLAGAGLLTYMSVYFIPPLLQNEPARYTIEEFPTKYRGEGWLRVDGRLAIAHLRTTDALGTLQGKAVGVHVPLTPANWKPADPVHVFVTFDSIAIDQLEAWRQKHQGRGVQVTGITRTLGGLPYERLFPDIAVGTPAVTIIAGAEPTGIGVVLLMLALGLILVFCCGRAIASILRP